MTYFTPAVASNNIVIIQPIERRAVIEIGSGSIKLQVADVDAGSNAITKVVYQTKGHLALSKSKAIGAPFSEETIASLLGAIKKLKGEAEQQGENCEFSGFATAVFRDAPNSAAVTERIQKELGIKIKVVTAEEEGRLGFETAAIISQVAADKMIVWDSGAGSTQFMRKNGDKIEVVSMEGFGGQVIANKIQEKFKRGELNPISQMEYEESLKWISSELTDLPQEWDLSKYTIVALGAFSKAARQDGKFSSFKRVDEAARARCGKTDKELDLKKFDSQAFQTGSHILSAAVMGRYKIDQVKYVDAEGNTTAYLVAPEVWKKK